MAKEHHTQAQGHRVAGDALRLRRRAPTAARTSWWSRRRARRSVYSERVVFDGHDAPPEKQLNPRKKLWDRLQPEMNTAPDGTARFQQLPFSTPHGPCKCASIAGGAIK